MISLRVGSIASAWMMLGVATVLLTLGALWALLELGPGRSAEPDASRAAAAGNQFASTGLISQTRFPPLHPGATSPPSGVDGESRDNLPVLALTSIAFLFLASLPFALRRKVRCLGKSGQLPGAVLADRHLPAANSTAF